MNAGNPIEPKDVSKLLTDFTAGILERGLEVLMRELARLELRAVRSHDQQTVDRLRRLGDAAITAQGKLRAMQSLIGLRRRGARGPASRGVDPLSDRRTLNSV